MRDYSKWGLLVVVLLGLVLRILAARAMYPVPGDAGHFVQHGVELAHGNRDALSAYWSQGMVVLAAGAEHLSISPAKTLQAIVVFSGILTVVLAWWGASMLFGSSRYGIVAAALFAVNPALVHYSVTGYSEMPFMAAALAGTLLIWLGLRRERAWLYIVSGNIVLAVAAYFKGSDASVISGIIFIYSVLYFWRTKSRRQLYASCAGLLVFLALVMPLCVFTKQKAGVFAPGSKGLNLALGDQWSDSKVLYAIETAWEEESDYLKSHGAVAYIWKNKSELSRRWLTNTAQSVRLVTNQVFCGPFRVGPAWFIFFMVLGACLVINKEKLWRWSYLIGIGGVPLLLINLCLVHDRLVLMATVIVLFIVGDMAVTIMDKKFFSRRIFWVILLFGFAGVIKYAQLSLNVQEREWYGWRYNNMQSVGERLKEFGNDQDKLMANGPHIAISFFDTNMLNTVELPYASVQETENYAAKQRITLLAVSDQARPHWPIARIFDDQAVPANWKLLDEVSFPGDDFSGIPAERYRLYRRADHF